MENPEVIPKNPLFHIASCTFPSFSWIMGLLDHQDNALTTVSTNAIAFKHHLNNKIMQIWTTWPLMDNFKQIWKLVKIYRCKEVPHFGCYLVGTILKELQDEWQQEST